MDRTQPTVIGIDIGSSTTKISAVLKGTIDIITNEANFRETPTVVGYGDGERKMGELGNVKLGSNWKNSVVSVQRFLGLAGDGGAVRKELAYCPCPTKMDGDRVFFKVSCNGKEENLAPEQVMASFITHLAGIVRFNELDSKLFVFSVPSFWTQTEKQALLNAAEIAGIRNVRLVSDAVAVGLDYGGFKKSQLGDGKTVAFVDFGYSKLSLSLIRFTETNMEVLLQKSNRNLGCRNIDEKIFNWIAKNFQAKTGLDLKQNKKAKLKLMEVVQKQRKILSAISETEIAIECLMEDEDLFESINREIMYKEAGEIFNQIFMLIHEFRESAIKMGYKIDSVELVGGGSRMPRIIQIIEQVFSMPSSRTTNSSETIAKGATIAAVQFSGLFRFHCFDIFDLSAHCVRLDWKENQGGMKGDIQFPEKNSQLLIGVNERIPVQKTVRIQTARDVEIRLSYVGLEEQVCNQIMTINCPAPKSNQLILTFSIDQNSFITLHPQTQTPPPKITHPLAPSPQKLSQYRTKQSQMCAQDRSIIALYQKKNELESFIYKQKEILEGNKNGSGNGKEAREAVEGLIRHVLGELEDEKLESVQDYDKRRLEIQTAMRKCFGAGNQNAKGMQGAQGTQGPRRIQGNETQTQNWSKSPQNQNLKRSPEHIMDPKSEFLNQQNPKFGNQRNFF